ncbi:MAG: Stk1 family PASTA domain-containing Ser/Thr kinase [Intrasporangium sp.]|uniref:Stk1 family PASTA domain-containing Ser/Thr kinase n=1 Tax=Intrasporangium sp. TaxID=1925024 RepID=UPI0026478F5F|nr:Stk1 family PASTA domain-containing Ser/Thr kinase [Intrasporangium sp.]MDN5795140.1 Stk1 family PASTA domain-containing Ser/Thr kinase [Intrasporangium sp.]
MTSSVTDALVGQVIDGRYRILSHLADGGMASVYVAMDARLERRVALKIMRPGLASDHLFVDRFRREARAAARLSHPNVVAVFDQGEDGGEVFLVMELVAGKTLREVIHAEAPLTAREALAVLEPILEALRAAHDADIIHRDVKPENVLVRTDGEVKVADFGLARAAGSQSTTSQSGVVLGTASYLSPEQVEHGTSDARSDLYAAGLLLFEMLTGRKAVTGETAIQIAYRHVHGTIEPPSEIVPTVPTALDEMVARATATEPADRFPDAATFLGALRSVRGLLSSDELDRRGVAGPAPEAPSEPDAHRSTSPTQALGTTTDPPAAPAAHEAAPVLSPTAALPIPATNQRPRTRRRWPLVALLLSLLVLGGSAGWWFTVGPGGTTLVPDVAGVRLEQAEGSLVARHLRGAPTEAFSESVPRGQVIGLTPTAGTEVRKRSVVTLVVSKGPERYTVPDLTGVKAGQVERTLHKLTLTLGPRTEQWSETVPKGEVVSQDPATGTSVGRGAAVSLVVSKGREPITVPEVVGKPLTDAQAAITAAGLEIERADDAHSGTVAKGSVISQKPAEGTLHRGDKVTVTVSKGPVMVQVPSVVGKRVKAAEKTLTDLGLKVRIERPLGEFFELVRNQSVRAGQSAPKGSTIVLTVV